MSDQNEKLSSLLDDYRDTEQDRSVLDGLEADVNQQYTLRRYHMIGNVMRNEMPDAVDLDFASRVRSLIDQEEALQVPADAPEVKQGRSSWLASIFFKPVAGLAVAATVAVVTVSSLQLDGTSVEKSTSVAAVNSSQAEVERLANLPVVQNAVRVSGRPQNAGSSSGTTWKIKRSKPDMQSRLNNYLVNHNEYSNSLQGIIPQARVVGFDGNR